MNNNGNKQTVEISVAAAAAAYFQLQRAQ